ncbi:MAG TPA: hypothetical protein VK993_07140 [Chthoniobacterales bacterium]|nr:hypothetical protein [Chthoniobacterales bacterium]
MPVLRFVADLPRGTPVGEYAFWLANRARFSSVEHVHGDNFDLLLVVDENGRAAALNAGYGLEEHLREEDLQATLDAFTDKMRGGDMPAGVQSCLDVITERLSAKWASLHAQPRRAPAANAPAEESWA